MEIAIGGYETGRIAIDALDAGISQFGLASHPCFRCEPKSADRRVISDPRLGDKGGKRILLKAMECAASARVLCSADTECPAESAAADMGW